MDRLYCTLAELYDDLGQDGGKSWREAIVIEKIRAASQHIEGWMGNFIPITETKYIDGPGGIDLEVPPLLAVTSIVDDTLTLLSSDYLLYPRQRLWELGPYVRITIDPDATSLSVWSFGDNLIAVVGRWGLFEQSKSSGATATQADASTTSLVVDNAANISPGMVALIESEQELVEATGAATDSTANLAEALDASEEEIDLNDSALVNVGEILKVDFEQMRLLDKKSNTCLVVRGYNGSTKTTHLTGADVYVYRTFTVKRGVNGTTAAAHAAKAVSRYIVPADINGLCRQLAALALKKAASGYAGKVGNAELGEVFYFQEFPKEPIEQVKRNYFVPIL